jgi:hypothetical protein
MSRNRSTLAWGLAALLVVSSAMGSEPDLVDYGPYEACVERLFQPPAPSVTVENELVARVEIVADTCDAKIQVILIQAAIGEPVSVRVLLAYPESPPPLGPAESVIDQSCPMVRELIPSGKNLPSEDLQSHVEDLAALRISPVPDPILWLHGVRYDLWLASPLAAIEFHFWAPASPKPGKSGLAELDIWIRRLLGLLRLDCLNEPSPVEPAEVGAATDETGHATGLDAAHLVPRTSAVPRAAWSPAVVDLRAESAYLM